MLKHLINLRLFLNTEILDPELPQETRSNLLSSYKLESCWNLAIAYIGKLKVQSQLEKNISFALMTDSLL